MTDCNKRAGLWQLSQRRSMRAFDNVAGLHLLIAKLLVHFHSPTDHQNSVMCNHIIFFCCVSTSEIPLSYVSQIVYLNGFYLAVKLNAAIYNRRPITLSHLHMVRMNPNRSISQPCQLLPSTTCHQDILQQYQRKHFGDCVSCVLSSVSLN